MFNIFIFILIAIFGIMLFPKKLGWEAQHASYFMDVDGNILPPRYDEYFWGTEEILSDDYPIVQRISKIYAAFDSDVPLIVVKGWSISPYLDYHKDHGFRVVVQDGFIGLVDAYCPTPEEADGIIAAVIAHELGHYQLQHYNTETGDCRIPYKKSGEQARQVCIQMEMDADHMGVLLLKDAGVSGYKMIDLFDLWKSHDRDGDFWCRSHPPYKLRMEHIYNYI